MRPHYKPVSQKRNFLDSYSLSGVKDQISPVEKLLNLWLVSVKLH
jgi:hypothetical protein